MKQRPDLEAAVARGFERMAQGKNGYLDILPAELIGSIARAPVVPEKEIPGTRDQAGTLSQRERQVLLGASHGLTNEGIAETFGLSHNTIKSHLRNACRKLQAKNRAHAVATALRRGLIP